MEFSISSVVLNPSSASTLVAHSEWDTVEGQLRSWKIIYPRKQLEYSEGEIRVITSNSLKFLREKTFELFLLNSPPP